MGRGAPFAPFRVREQGSGGGDRATTISIPFSVRAMDKTHIAVEPRGTRSWLAGAVEAGAAPSWNRPTLRARSGATTQIPMACTGCSRPTRTSSGYNCRGRASRSTSTRCATSVIAAGPAGRACMPTPWRSTRCRPWPWLDPGLPRFSLSTTWGKQYGKNLLGAAVVVLGGGGITESFLRLLVPFGRVTTVVVDASNPSVAPMVVGIDQLDQVLPAPIGSSMLALALTPETIGIINERRSRMLAPDAWVVNVARGATSSPTTSCGCWPTGAIGGAALDVTDPEPLPDGHPLWIEPLSWSPPTRETRRHGRAVAAGSSGRQRAPSDRGHGAPRGRGDRRRVPTGREPDPSAEHPVGNKDRSRCVRGRTDPSRARRPAGGVRWRPSEAAVASLSPEGTRLLWIVVTGRPRRGAIGVAYLGSCTSRNGPSGRPAPPCCPTADAHRRRPRRGPAHPLAGNPGDVELLVDNIHLSGGAADDPQPPLADPRVAPLHRGGGALGPEAPLVPTTGAVGS